MRREKAGAKCAMLRGRRRGRRRRRRSWICGGSRGADLNAGARENDYPRRKIATACVGGTLLLLFGLLRDKAHCGRPFIDGLLNGSGPSIRAH